MTYFWAGLHVFIFGLCSLLQIKWPTRWGSFMVNLTHCVVLCIQVIRQVANMWNSAEGLCGYITPTPSITYFYSVWLKKMLFLFFLLLYFTRLCVFNIVPVVFVFCLFFLTVLEVSGKWNNNCYMVFYEVKKKLFCYLMVCLSKSEVYLWVQLPQIFFNLILKLKEKQFTQMKTYMQPFTWTATSPLWRKMG